MTTAPLNKVDFCDLPRRLFLDTSALQNLQRYGEFIYDGGTIEPNDKIRRLPDGIDNIFALRQIMFVGKRAMFELALSNNSFYEVSDSGNLSYIDWAFEVQNYWTQLLNGYDASNSEPFDGHGVAMDSEAQFR